MAVSTSKLLSTPVGGAAITIGYRDASTMASRCWLLALPRTTATTLVALPFPYCCMVVSIPKSYRQHRDTHVKQVGTQASRQASGCTDLQLLKEPLGADSS